MTNFTREIKKDLLRVSLENRCCRLSLLAAFFQTSGFIRYLDGSPSCELRFTSEKEEIAQYVLGVFEELFGVPMELLEAVRDPKYGRNKLTFSYAGDNAASFADQINAYRAENVLERDCCIRAYLQGAFLGGGSGTLPHGEKKTGYHLEFVFRTDGDAQAFCELLERLQLLGSVIARGEKHVVYLKSREAISDFLYIVGARSALKKMENLSEERDRVNRENRVNNCFIGNADKTAIASAEHIVALKKLQQSGALAGLKEELQQVALLRMEQPTLSLAELAAMLGIGKSCLNHRMRKLMQIYAQTEKHI